MRQRLLTLLLVGICAPLVSMGMSRKEIIEKDGKYFTDPTYTKFKRAYRMSGIDKVHDPALREMAQQMFDGTYDYKYRATEYEAYPSPDAIYKLLKLRGGWSKYDNMTGIYLEKGENVVIVGPTHGKEIKLLIPDWTRQPGARRDWSLHRQEIPLKQGVNVINVEKAGNVYVSYFDDDPANAPKIFIHFITGKVNKFFDSTIHTNEDFNRMLEEAVYPVLDCRSKYMQVAYTVEDLKKFAWGQGKELMDNYDKIIGLEYELMGLFKYNRVPKNRMLAAYNTSTICSATATVWPISAMKAHCAR